MDCLDSLINCSKLRFSFSLRVEWHKTADLQFYISQTPKRGEEGEAYSYNINELDYMKLPNIFVLSLVLINWLNH